MDLYLGAHIQNNNENLYFLIWSFAKHTLQKAVEIVTFLAIRIFNKRFCSTLHIMSLMGITIGLNPEMYAINRNDEHVILSKRQASVDLTTSANVQYSQEEDQNFFLKKRRYIL